MKCFLVSITCRYLIVMNEMHPGRIPRKELESDEDIDQIIEKKYYDNLPYLLEFVDRIMVNL